MKAAEGAGAGIGAGGAAGSAPGPDAEKGQAAASAAASGGIPWPGPAAPFPAYRGVKSVLIIKTSALGDIVHALPSLYALRSLFPEARVGWAVEPRFADLLPGPPWIDFLVPFRKAEMRAKTVFGKIKALKELRREMLSRRFDLALDLQGLMKSTMIALLSGARRRLGYCEMREGSSLFTRAVKGPNRDGHVIRRYMDVVGALGPAPGEVRFPLPGCGRERERFRARLAAEGDGRPLALLFPGAGWPSKLWPAASYAALAVMLADSGMAVALGGGPADAPLAREIASTPGAPPMPDLCGATDIKGLMGLTSLASLCVGADTGPLHLAAAQGTPTVSLFGPSSGERAGTWGPAARYVASGAPCSPCFKRSCPAKEFVCMGGIEPSAVFGACRELMGLFPPEAAGRFPQAPPGGVRP
ncbi:MAG: glycosyltransferase family 9 protein [Deltaproteobacteria bacterium]|nr:glycosyltransferase family 9 protein [Deltaproteobacteria bacterium]